MVQFSCKVTAISKFKSTTASLSVSTASLKPISVIQQQMLLKIFMASFPLHARRGAVVRPGMFPGLMGSNELHLCLHTNPKTAGFEPDFGRSCSSRLKRMAGSKRACVSPVTLQCVTDLLFSFKCFWNVCKLWLRYH